MGATKSGPLLKNLGEELKKDEAAREKLIDSIKALVVYDIDGDKFTLDVRPGKGELYEGEPKEGEAEVTLVVSDANFVDLVMGKTNPQMAFITRKLKIKGPMNLALKLLPALELANPAKRSKL